MSDMVKVRKIVTIVEEIFHEGGPIATTPVRRGATLAVIANPYAGGYVEDVQPMMEALKPLGMEMSQRLIDALGGEPAAITSYGKGSIVGTAGESEHGALWHVPGGYAMREKLGGALAIVPSAAKVGGMGAHLDVPISHKDASYVRSHFDAMAVGVPDGPRPDEIVFALVMATGGRIHARMGGLQAHEIKAKDGLR